MRQALQMICLVGALCMMTAMPVKASAVDGGIRSTLQYVRVYQGAAVSGDSVMVGVDAQDGDGIERIQVRFQNDDTGEILNMILRETAGDAAFEEEYGGLLTLPGNAGIGIYRLKSVEIIDRRSNSSVYSRAADRRLSWNEPLILEELPGVAIVEDANTLALLECRVEQQNVTPNGLTFLTVSAQTGASELVRAEVTFDNQSGKQLHYVLTEDERLDDGRLQAPLEVSGGEQSSSYHLSRVLLRDEAGREQTWALNGRGDTRPLAVACSFSVSESQHDDVIPPRLLSVSAARAGELGDSARYLLEVRATDDRMGIDHITVRFRNDENGRFISHIMTAKDRRGDIYFGQLEINRYEPPGTFSLDSVSLTDRADNYQAYCRPEDVTEANRKLALPAQVKLIVPSTQDAADAQAPTLRTISMMTVQAQIGETLTVMAQTDDDLSGVDRAELRFLNAEGKGISVTLVPRGTQLEGVLQASQTRQAGMYRLVRARLYDHAGNMRVYAQSPDEKQELLPCEVCFVLEANADEAVPIPS